MKFLFALLVFVMAAHCQNVPAAPDKPCSAPDVTEHATQQVFVVHVPMSDREAWQRLNDEAEAIKLLQQDARDWRIVDLERRRKLRKLFTRINTEW